MSTIYYDMLHGYCDALELRRAPWWITYLTQVMVTMARIARVQDHNFMAHYVQTQSMTLVLQGCTHTLSVKQRYDNTRNPLIHHMPYILSRRNLLGIFASTTDCLSIRSCRSSASSISSCFLKCAISSGCVKSSSLVFSSWYLSQ